MIAITTAIHRMTSTTSKYHLPSSKSPIHASITQNHQASVTIAKRQLPSPSITHHHPILYQQVSSTIAKYNPPSPSITHSHQVLPTITKYYPPSPSITHHHQVSSTITKYHLPSPSIIQIGRASCRERV